MAGEAVGLLERIDEILLPYEVAQSAPVADDLAPILDEVDALVEENIETGISILPTAVDERELAAGALLTSWLPVSARQVGMFHSVAIGQRRFKV